ncbi:hypothetical protein GALL_534370 [mine drainage metagenome]|uniref:Uncharacterized protein n=1 Tax=mine drainage metagenome TaxID=410659 RepID=A0A1J5P2X1_9ZZZZ
MSWAARESDNVTVGSSPSGTSATVAPTAKRKLSVIGRPSTTAITKNPAPTTTAMIAMTRTTVCSCPASGLRGRTAPCVTAAMPARRVRPPVATTSASPCPSTTYVPAYSGPPESRPTVTLSPVSIDSSTLIRPAAVRTRSAETLSPASRTTTSPVTRSAASTIRVLPSRRTVVRTGRRSRSRSAARSARYSCANANAPLRTTTTAIAAASAGIRASQARAAATHSITAKKCTI